MKVFISSIITGYDEYRNATASAISSVGYKVIRAEGFSARPETPRQACLAEVRKSDIVILILGAKYGYIQDSGFSATQEEWEEAVKEHKQVLVFVENINTEDSRQKEFIEKVEGWSTGHLRMSFNTPEDLRNKVIKSLFDMATADQPDSFEIRSRAENILPENWQSYSERPVLFVAVAAGPRRVVIRPSQLNKSVFIRKIQKEAMFGQESILDSQGSTCPSIDNERLVLKQDKAMITIDEYGTVLTTQPAEKQSDRGFYPVIIEEDLQDNIAKTLRFVCNFLNIIDKHKRMTHVMPIVAISGADFSLWRTEDEQRNNPDNFTPIKIQPCMIASDSLRPRTALFVDAKEMAEDFTFRLRRRSSANLYG